MEVCQLKQKLEETLRQRERELTALKGALKEEVANHDKEIEALREQYSTDMEKLRSSMEQVSQVWTNSSLMFEVGDKMGENSCSITDQNYHSSLLASLIDWLFICCCTRPAGAVWQCVRKLELLWWKPKNRNTGVSVKEKEKHLKPDLLKLCCIIYPSTVHIYVWIGVRLKSYIRGVV